MLKKRTLINNLGEMKLKKYTNTLLGIAAIIGLSAGSSAFADSIHGALENNRVANETVEAKTITSKRESAPRSPRSIQYYLEAGRI